MKFRLTLAVAAAMSIVSGSALATKAASECLVAPFALFKVVDIQLKLVKKYCSKAPDAALAVKLGEKFQKKANKFCEKHNDKLAKLDCATNGDPDAGAVMPLPEPCVPTAPDLTMVDPVCDGV